MLISLLGYAVLGALTGLLSWSFWQQCPQYKNVDLPLASYVLIGCLWPVYLMMAVHRSVLRLRNR